MHMRAHTHTHTHTHTHAHTHTSGEIGRPGLRTSFLLLQLYWFSFVYPVSKDEVVPDLKEFHEQAMHFLRS